MFQLIIIKWAILTNRAILISVVNSSLSYSYVIKLACRDIAILCINKFGNSCFMRTHTPPAVVGLHTPPPTPTARNPNPPPPSRRLRPPNPIQPDTVPWPINCPPLPVPAQEDAHASTLLQRASDSPEFDLNLTYITERIIGKLYMYS